MNVVSCTRGEMELFAGTANSELAAEVADQLGRSLGRLSLSRFPDGEVNIRIDSSVRGKDVFVIQPTSPPVNENLAELLIMVDALHRASAGRITVVVPYYGYARQDKKAAGREPITARMVADLLTVVGADRIMTIDLHSPQIQGFFSIPVDHLSSVELLARHVQAWQMENAVVVSPDAGRVGMATEYANRLGLPVVIVHKRRIGPEHTEAQHVIGEVCGKRPIIIDDMISTGGTVARTVEALVEAGAVQEIGAAATHAVLVGSAVENLAHPAISRIVVTNTIAIPPDKRLEKMEVASVAPLIASAIERVHRDKSVSELLARAA